MLLSVVLIPLALGILCILTPRIASWLVILGCVPTAAYNLWILLKATAVRLTLMDSFGVSLLADPTAAWFMLTNAAVFFAVVLYCRSKPYSPFFYTMLAVLHGCLNACFVSDDLFNLYVVIELSTIIAFLLIGTPMQDRHLWNALRYLFISNVGMLFFLIGAIMVYEAKGTFAFGATATAPPIALVLITIGLTVKGGVFIPGLWLPLAHAEAETPVSALLSGVVVKIGVLPLLRIAMLSEQMDVVIRSLGTGGALLGIFFALFQRDVKRLLACSTISQIGFMLAAPAAGAFYAFSHGLAKAALFLTTSGLPSRDFSKLGETGIAGTVWVGLIAASLSICGAPLWAGFSAKAFIFGSLAGWQSGMMLAASVGTATILARLIFLPPTAGAHRSGFAWKSVFFLVGVLLVLGVRIGPYEPSEWFKAGAVVLIGWSLHLAGAGRLARIELPDRWERFEDLVGMTCVVLLILMLWVKLL